jgi:hypothetical protein
MRARDLRLTLLVLATSACVPPGCRREAGERKSELPAAERGAAADSTPAGAGARVTVDCKARATRVSPYVFGFAAYPFDDDDKQAAQWLLQGTTRRWGGNATSTYNWKAGVWNTGFDWFFENHPISFQKYLDENGAHGIPGAVTVPIMGYVAKDGTSSSFPVSAFGAQQATDQWRPEAGNGKDKDGKELRAKLPPPAYQAVTPAFVKEWVQALRAADAKRGSRSVWMYILDNEPMIWSTTHRDMHPDPVSYDELLRQTIDYGTAIREADPDAVIAGPASWGWPEYFYSGVDMAQGGPAVRPDRRAHGDLPLLAYYLKTLAEHEKKTGVRVLDVLDVHAYPYTEISAKVDPESAALRLRSTRLLWDPSYVDESWVKEPVKILPRLREWIDQYYPGRGISIGEWNFGGDKHMSGALATAEALGRFTQFGLRSAFYWTYPQAGSPVVYAFRAFRNYDGKGSHFLDWFVPAKVAMPAPGGGAYVSRDDSGQNMVAVLLNFSPTEELGVSLDVTSCGAPRAAHSYTYTGGSSGFVQHDVAPLKGALSQTLPPYSITVLETQLDDAASVIQ